MTDHKDMLARTRIPLRFHGATFAEYGAESDSQRRILAVVKKYASAFPERLKAGGCMAFLGNVGTGKTHLLCALALELMPSWRVRYTDAWGLISSIKATWNRPRDYKGGGDTEEELFARLAAYDLLMIDEIGVQFGSDAERALVHRVIDLRYQAVKPTIVAGNLDLAGLAGYIGERAVSRLHENRGAVLMFDWADHRMKRK